MVEKGVLFRIKTLEKLLSKEVIDECKDFCKGLTLSFSSNYCRALETKYENLFQKQEYLN